MQCLPDDIVVPHWARAFLGMHNTSFMMKQFAALSEARYDAKPDLAAFFI